MTHQNEQTNEQIKYRYWTTKQYPSARFITTIDIKIDKNWTKINELKKVK